MNGRTTIRRESEGLSLPFGAAGVAAIGAALFGLIGLVLPRVWLETAAFQLYLDTIIPAAKAPLGATAQFVAALLLAIAGALAGYLVAWIFDITASPGGFSGLLARLRGELAEDEEDAPPLRAADRHPDAPARRPFSAARDIPDDIGTTIEGVAQQHFDSEDELLLDLPVAELAPEPESTPTREPSLRSVAGLHSVADSGAVIDDAAFEPADTMPLVTTPVEAMATDELPTDEMTVARGSALDAMDGFDLSPPTLDDWESGSFGEQPEPAMESVEEPDPVLPAEPEPEPVMAYAPPPPRVTPPPLDLSAARLDELIARLEAGLTRKVVAASPAAAEALADDGDTLVDERPAAPPAPEPEPDPAFPHDPALAAALATLRKMNLRSV